MIKINILFEGEDKKSKLKFLVFDNLIDISTTGRRVGLFVRNL